MKLRKYFETITHKIRVENMTHNILEFKLAMVPKREIIDCIACSPQFV